MCASLRFNFREINLLLLFFHRLGRRLASCALIFKIFFLWNKNFGAHTMVIHDPDFALCLFLFTKFIFIIPHTTCLEKSVHCRLLKDQINFYNWMQPIRTVFIQTFKKAIPIDLYEKCHLLFCSIVILLFGIFFH